MNNDEPLAIIAGIALGSRRRHRPRMTHRGWRILTLPGHDYARGKLNKIWKRVLREWENGPSAGTHLVLAHDAEHERPNFIKLIKERSLRATWLPRELSNQYGSEEFIQMICKILSFEEQWRNRLRPTINSPIMLPHSAFAARPHVENTWNRVSSVSLEKDCIKAVEKSISRFRDSHKRRGNWRDDKELEFSNRENHGSHGLPLWRRQKFTFQFPDGFHFNVRHVRGRRFSVVDHEGESEEFNEYTNIDPHGFLRGGR